MSPGSPSPWTRLPPWSRWALTLGISVALAIALVVFVDRHNSDNLATQSPTAVLRGNREAEIVVAQDQAPHTAALVHGTADRAAFAEVVRTYVSGLISKGQIDGPLQRVTCTTAGASSAGRGFRCTATASDVNYDFLGVVDTRARRITYCKRDPPPVPSVNIPVSRRCMP